ncbi:hypothetical protein FS837_001703, partial [Tulasnella sp. UAMH 9824]
MSPPPVELFKGTSWEECNKFILEIRTRAMWEGKQRDFAWMADFAATYLWQDAMWWHCRLPQDVRQDWLKLETALVDKWAPPNASAQISPTPAAADAPQEGILKVVSDEVNTEYYLQFNYNHCTFTTSASEAGR